MTTLREAAELALEALECGRFAVANQAPHLDVMAYLEATDALRTALAEQTVPSDCSYSHQHKPLTDEEIATLLSQSAGVDMKLNGGDLLFARAIERAHGIGGEK